MLNVIYVSNNNGGLNVANVKADGLIAKATGNNNFTDGLMPLFMSHAKNDRALPGQLQPDYF